jgi:hypothetical protein
MAATVVFVEHRDNPCTGWRLGILKYGQQLGLAVVNESVRHANCSNVVHVHAPSSSNVGVDYQRDWLPTLIG